jgi:hypothetical protein
MQTSQWFQGLRGRVVALRDRYWSRWTGQHMPASPYSSFTDDDLVGALFILVDREQIPAGAATERPAGSAVTWACWSDSAIPDFSRYSAIVAEVPADEEYANQYESDVLQAEAAGAIVIWLVGPKSDSGALSKITGTEVFRQRSPRRIEAPVAGEFSDYLASTDCSLLMRTPDGARALAPVGATSNLTSAFLDDRKYPHIRVVVPLSASPSEAMPKLHRIASIVSGQQAPVTIARQQFLFGAGMLLVFMGMAVGMRYVQRTINQFSEASGMPYHFVTAGEDSDPINDSIWDEPDKLHRTLFVEKPIVDLDAVEMAAKFGALKLVVSKVQYALKSDDCDSVRSLFGTLHRQAWKDAAYGGYENSRRLMQLAMQVANAGRCGPMTGDAFFHARRLHSVLTTGYIWHEAEVLNTMHGKLSPSGYYWSASDAPVDLDEKKVNSTLRHEAAYLNLASRYWHFHDAGDVSRDDIEDLRLAWTKLATEAKQRRDNLYEEQAAYNAVITRMLAMRTSKKVPDEERIRRITAAEFARFAQAYRSSYLADDALLLAVIFSTDNKDRGATARYLDDLLDRHPRTDSYDRLQDELRGGLAALDFCSWRSCREEAGLLLAAALDPAKGAGAPAPLEDSTARALKRWGGGDSKVFARARKAITVVLER